MILLINVEPLHIYYDREGADLLGIKGIWAKTAQVLTMCRYVSGCTDQLRMTFIYT